jgi:hypothetical protein
MVNGDGGLVLTWKAIDSPAATLGREAKPSIQGQRKAARGVDARGGEQPVPGAALLFSRRIRSGLESVGGMPLAIEVAEASLAGEPFVPPIDVSVVIPVFNNAASLDELLDRLVAVMEANGGSFEIVAVDDGSRDQSFAILEQRAAADPRIRPFAMVRNFGSQAASCAGFDLIRGRRVATSMPTSSSSRGYPVAHHGPRSRRRSRLRLPGEPTGSMVRASTALRVC